MSSIIFLRLPKSLIWRQRYRRNHQLIFSYFSQILYSIINLLNIHKLNDKFFLKLNQHFKGSCRPAASKFGKQVHLTENLYCSNNKNLYYFNEFIYQNYKFSIKICKSSIYLSIDNLCINFNELKKKRIYLKKNKSKFCEFSRSFIKKCIYSQRQQWEMIKIITEKCQF